MQATIHTLTPAQFIAARALGRAYYHLWKDVPDGTYDVEEIRKIASEWQFDMLPAGIEAPTILFTEQGFPFVYHVTGSGRLHWSITAGGSVLLEIYRPGDLSSAHAQAARTFAYASIGGLSTPTDNGIPVARVQLINDDDNVYAPTDDFLYHSSSYTETEGRVNGHACYDDTLQESFLFERHVHALIRPLVALLTAHAQQGEEENEEDYRARIIQPAIEQAKLWLQPLFERAFPDPEDRSKRMLEEDVASYEETLREYPDAGSITYYLEKVEYLKKKLAQMPETYWTISTDDDDDEKMTVHRLGESFPVESEKTAVHAVLLLQKYPGMPFLEAIKQAIVSSSYRP